MKELNLIGIAGSLRKGSFNKKLLTNAQKLTPDKIDIDIVGIGDVPFFNEDIESTRFPNEVSVLKEKIEASDGIIISTPEYNRSIPGGLKNAIDWISRPAGKNSFAGKPVLVLGASIGGISTAIAQSHLKHTLLYLDCKVLGQPEFYLGNANEKFNDENLTDEETAKFLKKMLETFENFIKKDIEI